LDAGGTLIDHDWTWSPDSPTKIVPKIEGTGQDSVRVSFRQIFYLDR
jgi:hypothetical protein